MDVQSERARPETDVPSFCHGPVNAASHDKDPCRHDRIIFIPPRIT